MADKINVFEAQKWAFSFADDHGMERSTIDMLICGQMDWDGTHLLMQYRDEFSKEDFEVFRQNVEKCACCIKIAIIRTVFYILLVI